MLHLSRTIGAVEGTIENEAGQLFDHGTGTAVGRPRESFVEAPPPGCPNPVRKEGRPWGAALS